MHILGFAVVEGFKLVECTSEGLNEGTADVEGRNEVEGCVKIVPGRSNS